MFSTKPFIFDRITKVRSFDGPEQTTLLVLSKTGLESIDCRCNITRISSFVGFSTNAYWAAGSCLFHSRLIDLIEGHSPKQLSP